MNKILIVFGTRPEAIKLAPLINELKKSKKNFIKVCSTGQHNEMLNQVIDLFDIKIDIALNLMKRDQKVSSLMTKGNLITVSENISMDEAQNLLHKHRIEKLLVVDKDFKCVGLITVKDIEKAEKFPLASKDKLGRLLVGAAVGVGDEQGIGSWKLEVRSWKFNVGRRCKLPKRTCFKQLLPAAETHMFQTVASSSPNGHVSDQGFKRTCFKPRVQTHMYTICSCIGLT